MVDVAISESKISLIEPKINFPAKKVIDAKGLILTPGFIDIHGHTDHFLCVDPQSSSKVSQGVTTEVFGNCGYSPFLLKGKFKKHFQNELSFYGLDKDWHDLDSFSKRISEQKPAMNCMTLVGHGTLRLAAMGHDNRPPTPEEFKWMKRELEMAMDQGAFGLSSGLIYTPGCFAKIKELIELCKIVSRNDGFYATHMRSEGDKLIESIQESLRISRIGKVPLQISHLKTAGEKNWTKIDQVLNLLEKHLDLGEDITWDRYPYTASYTSLDTCLPRKLFDGGDLRAVERLKNLRMRSKYIDRLNDYESQFPQTIVTGLLSKKNKRWIGQSLRECSKISQKSIGEFVIDILCEEKMQVNAIFFSMSESNLDRIMLHSHAMIGSDASARSAHGKTFHPSVHPRTYGTFPRFLRNYSLKTNKISIEEAIYKMTGLPSSRLKLKKRGYIKPGFFADLVLLNPQKLQDRATYQHSTLYSEGIQMVFVNGKPVIENGKQTHHRSGIFIKHGQE
jgi:N-acyl-D-amino-acid deacylase